MKIKTLRSHITMTICMIVTLALLFSCLFFYKKTASVLTHNYKQLVLLQLNQINKQINEQITLIDSLPPLFMSNTLIRDALDPAYPTDQKPYEERRQSVEKQMSYLLINNYLRSEKLIDAVVIIDNEENIYCVTPDNKNSILMHNREVLNSVNEKETGLMIKTRKENDGTIYFARNLYSIYSGRKIATIIINVNQKSWTDYFSENLNTDWFVYLYGENLSVLSNDSLSPYKDFLSSVPIPSVLGSLQEHTIGGNAYFIASAKNTKIGLSSIVAAPRTQIFRELNATMKTYILVLVTIVCAAILISVVLSRAVTRPIEKMIYYIRRISQGNKDKMPALEMYSEFNQLASAFNQMLDQLDHYYRDNFDKQLLLKNAEIQALQAQMDPHFLFNVLNTIAWKSQMTDNQEVYQMVISLGELLKMNTVSKTSGFLRLKDELRYIQFYIYLQRMRFEDKITVEIQADSSLYEYIIPCFCIQPLIENAIVHGLEPKKGSGKLILNVIPSDSYMEISVIDNGIGFSAPPDIQNISPSMEDTHTHIGLRNLDKRLFLLFGESAHLQISSIPNECTTVSFKVPYRMDGNAQTQNI